MIGLQYPVLARFINTQHYNNVLHTFIPHVRLSITRYWNCIVI